MWGFALAKRLWRDQLGSSASAEMAMVTGVTVTALYMGVSQFTITVNGSFDDVASSAAMATSDNREESEKQKQEDSQRVTERERERNRQRFEKALAERRRKAGVSGSDSSADAALPGGQ